MTIKEKIKQFIPFFLLNFYHYCLALSGAFFYGFPSKKIKVIGVTGTSGKSTVVDLIAKILEEAGYKTAALSSIKFKIKEKEKENNLKMTMPGRFKIQKFLKQAIKANCQFVVLEVTSEGIKQHRHKFIDFETAVFTNLSPEHIEAHKGFENYRKAKLELFKAAKDKHIINADDENVKYFLNIPAKEKWLYKLKAQSLKLSEEAIPQNFESSTGGINKTIIKSLKAENVKLLENGIKFSVNNIIFNLNLLGEFNVYNALAAIAVGRAYGVDLEISKKALGKIKEISGRMEVVINEPFKVVVDYAHTPQSLEKVYRTLKSFKSQFFSSCEKESNFRSQSGLEISNSMICVLGSCGGGRDKWKRPVLGKLAGQYCDKIIITNEDPYDENPLSILAEIEKGLSQISNTKYQKILDRRQAIRKALELGKSGDIIIITGKGSEPWMCLENGKKIPWDDRQIVKEEFQKIKI